MEAKEMPSTIRLHGIRKLYRIGSETLAALDGIDLDIRRGEFAALMGPSGSGKSTLMNILGCLDRPSAGSYLLDGAEVAGLSDDALAATRNKKIGFVFQNFNLLPRISALDNVALPLVYAGVGRRERTERAQEMLAAVGLSDRGAHLPNELSGGQRQRLAIARALLHESPIYIFDEATSNIDVESEEVVMGVVRELAHERSVIVISHRLANVVDAERIYVLDAGSIVGVGDHDELLAGCPSYARLWRTQRELESYRGEGVHAYGE